MNRALEESGKQGRKENILRAKRKQENGKIIRKREK